MKILLAHDYYRTSAPSGEDTVVKNEIELLESHGHDLILYEKHNDELIDLSFSDKIKTALNGAWSKSTYNELTSIIRKNRPDVAHFHNTFPIISPSGWAACQDNNVPVVQTLHNYRYICPQALLQREGVPCEDCIGKNLLSALRHRCYRNSLFATTAQTWMIQYNRWRKSFTRNVNRYIALTHFAKSRMVKGGMPEHRITVKPNFLPASGSNIKENLGYAVFVGRLSEEKGIRTLVKAWTDMGGYPLKIIGSGPLEHEIKSFIEKNRLPIDMLGFRSRDDVLRIVGNATCQIVPSECYEGFPMVILEAYSTGTPVIASRIGSLDEIITEGVTGLKFEPGNHHDLAAKMKSFIADEGFTRDCRLRVREEFDKKYTSEINIKMLEDVYSEAIADFKESKN